MVPVRGQPSHKLYLVGGGLLALVGLIVFLVGRPSGNSSPDDVIGRDTVTPIVQPPVDPASAPVVPDDNTPEPAPIAVVVPSEDDANPSQPQVFDPNTWFSLKSSSLGASKCLESSQFDPASNEGHSFMTNCADWSGMSWKVVREGAHYRLKSMYQGDNKCLDGNNPDNGGAAFMADCRNDPGQRWNIVAVEDGGRYRLRSLYKGKSMCLDSNNPGSTAFGGKVFLGKCGKSGRQLWQLVPQ